MTASALAAPPAAVDTATGNPADTPEWRVTSIDFVRGVVMILMAIDHVRVYSGVPAGGPDPAVFFTRWITHFVAPAFVFLAGTSAYLHGRKLANPAALSKFLLLRGLWLVLLELTVIRIAWTFNFDFANYVLAGVIWAIGWCMVLMAVLVRLPVKVVGVLGVAIIALHNAFGGPLFGMAENGPLPSLWKVLYAGFFAGPIGPLVVLYSIIPWIGVMMAGYAFGTIATMEPARRRRITLALGLGAIALFVVLRGFDLYGDPRPWNTPDRSMPALLAFLNTAKYPASLSFLLMTLGPMLVLLALAERWQGRVARVATTFGRVPMFYYLLHIPVIHLAACAVSLVREGTINAWLFANHPMNPPPVPEGYRWPLWLLYAMVVLCVGALYVPCRWYARVRGERRYGWLSYI